MKSLRRWGLLQLAGWLRVLGAPAAALHWLETARREFPSDPRVLSAVAFAYAQAGRKRESLALFDRVAELSPEDAETEFNRGFLRQELNDHDAAIEAFKRVLDLKPKHDRALYGLALSLIALRRLDEAVAPLERNTKLQPMSPYGWYQLARVQFDRGHPEKTQAIIDELAKFEPKVAAQLARETRLRAPAPP